MRLIGSKKSGVDLTMPSFIDMVDEPPRTAHVLPRKPRMKESKKKRLGIPSQVSFSQMAQR